jgi:hypothetical protein
MSLPSESAKPEDAPEVSAFRGALIPDCTLLDGKGCNRSPHYPRTEWMSD